MKQFQFAAAGDVAKAIEAGAASQAMRYIAGGTSLLDLMKLEVETPPAVVDIHRLPLAEIRTSEQGIRIGAMTRNSALAFHPDIRERYPLLSAAILSGASAQLRNMATVGGNLMQRTRCTYFRDVHQACNKRVPGTGCDALEGFHRTHAIFGASDHCFATHPSDMSVALICLDAVVETQGPQGTRRIPIEEFHRLPGDTPHIETALTPGELIVAVELPNPPTNWLSRYLKVRDRASYEFALVSVALLLEIDGEVISNARVAFGGVATRPWRSKPAEIALLGEKTSLTAFRAAADEAVLAAVPRRQNRFKVELLKRTLIRTLCELTGVEQ